MVSILILTLNEERNLPSCLESVRWSDDVVVLDSFSVDKTIQIANEFGARVIQRKFDNWAAHQNWAMTQIAFKHPWVFYLDADERMTPELSSEILQISRDPRDSRVAFYCGRRNYFMGRWIKHAYPPSMIMRFFKPQKVRFERLVNPTPRIMGEHSYLKAMFDHYNFSKGLAEWFEKHNRYSDWEAIEGSKERFTFRDWARLGHFSDPAQRRKHLKALSYHLPCRGALRFFHAYILNLGFMDGLPGYYYCRLLATYEWMIAMKMKEIRLRRTGCHL